MSVIQTLREKYKCPIWIDGNGELIPISIMTNTRLWNCYKHVEKQLDECINIGTFLRPNGDTTIQDTSGYYDPDDDLVHRRLFLLAWKSKLEDELERRGLSE